MVQTPIQDTETKETLHLFHDESGSIGDERWFITGIALVQDKDYPEVVRRLKQARQEEDGRDGTPPYMGQVHYNELGAFAGEWEQKSRIAKKWFNEWYNGLHDKLRYSILAVDTEHQAYDPERFDTAFQAYNYWTGETIRLTLSYYKHLTRPNSTVELYLHTEEQERSPDDVQPKGIEHDNFKEYIKGPIKARINDRQKPPDINEVYVNEVATSNHRNNPTDEGEVIQFVDIMNGASRAAIRGNVEKEAKRWLGECAAHVFQSKASGDYPVDADIRASTSPSQQADLQGEERTTYDFNISTTLSSRTPTRYQDTGLDDFV